jgi:hypothetical protein
LHETTFSGVSLCLCTGAVHPYCFWGIPKTGDDRYRRFCIADGTHDAVLTVRNGGAAAGYSTDVSLVHAQIPLARQIALLESGDLFVIDDNDGAVRWGDRGQLDVKVRWVSNNELLVQFPSKARVFKEVTSYESTTVRYERLQ